MVFCNLDFELEELQRMFNWFVVCQMEDMVDCKDRKVAEKIASQLGKNYVSLVRHG